jgi:hypothetical protein
MDYLQESEYSDLIAAKLDEFAIADVVLK